MMIICWHFVNPNWVFEWKARFTISIYSYLNSRSVNLGVIYVEIFRAFAQIRGISVEKKKRAKQMNQKQPQSVRMIHETLDEMRILLWIFDVSRCFAPMKPAAPNSVCHYTHVEKRCSLYTNAFRLLFDI